MPIAVSRSTPVGSPSGPRSISPPGGAAVSRPMPARSSAWLLQTTMCAQVRMRTTGRSLTAASRSVRVGERPSAKRASLYPRPCSQVPGGNRPAWRAQPRRHVGEAGGAAHVEQRREQVTDLPDVRVRVDEPRDQRLPGQIHHTRVRPAQRQHFVTRAHGRNASARHRKRGRVSRTIDPGPQDAVLEDRLGSVRTHRRTARQDRPAGCRRSALTAAGAARPASTSVSACSITSSPSRN